MRKTSKEHVYVFVTFILLMLLLVVLLAYPVASSGKPRYERGNPATGFIPREAINTREIKALKRKMEKARREYLQKQKAASDEGLENPARQAHYEQELENAKRKLYEAEQAYRQAQHEVVIPYPSYDPTQNYYRMIESQNELDQARREYQQADLDAYMAKRRAQGSSLGSPRSAPYSPRRSPHSPRH